MKLPFPERVLHQHMATLGKTGAGKSSAMRVIAEHLLAKQRRICIVDPKGDWWGLKRSSNGSSAGYPVIMFGDFKEPRASDVPINPQSGKHVAELIATGNRPCVVGFRGWMPGQLVKFWLDFAPALFNANQGELNVIIDEVHNFAPKGKIMDPESGKCLHWTNRIMSEGRGLGLTFFIASQRPQKVHNDTLDNCETLIAMRVAHPAARGAIKDWIDGNGDPAKGKEVLATLAQLKRGEAWVWSPENEFGPERVQFPMFETFDSFAPPQLQKKVSDAGWSSVDLEAVKQKLATVIAEAKANDPKELKAEILRLRQELAKKPAAAAPTTKVEEKIVEVPTITAEDKLVLEFFRSGVDNALHFLEGFTKDLNAATAAVNTAMARAQQRPAPKKATAPVHVIAPKVQYARFHEVGNSPKKPAQSMGDFGRVEQNILDQLAELEALGISQPTKAQLSLMCGYSNPRSGGFSEPVAKLLETGLIAYPAPGLVQLTDQGSALAKNVARPLSTDELHERLYRKLGGAEEKILREIIAAYPEAMQKEDLAARCGYSSPRSGGFSEPISRLRQLGIIESPAPGQVKCADWLFLDAT
jgi:uncharacterized protein